MLNVRNSFEPIFVSAMGNDAGLVRSLIIANKASVFDVTNDSRHSPLHVNTEFLLDI
jgi:hypothetical protein